MIKIKNKVSFESLIGRAISVLIPTVTTSFLLVTIFFETYTILNFLYVFLMSTVIYVELRLFETGLHYIFTKAFRNE